MTKKLGLLLLLLTVVPAVAQVPYIETLEVRVHSIDVVVTDAKGKPVAGLGPADFQLFEDGVEKPISNFSGVAGGGQAILPVLDGRDRPSSTSEPQRAPRKFIFYVDEMSLGASQKKLEKELARLIDTAMQPGDEAMIVRPAEEQKLTTPFIGDREAVRKALLEAVREEGWRADAPILREMRLLEQQLGGVSTSFAARVGARRWAGLVRARAEQRLGQLRAVVNAAAGIEGRKVLVLITESLPLEPGKEAFTAMGDVVTVPIDTAFYDGSPVAGQLSANPESTIDWVSLKPLVEEIGRTAATNGISIYPVQPEYGLSLLAPGGDIGAANPTRTSEVRSQASVARLTSTGKSVLVEHMTSNTEATLAPLAAMTGGTWHRGGLQLDDVVNRIVEDVSSYYSLGYRAGDAFDTAHKIEVRVKGRPDLKVRTRQEVMRKSPQREMTDRVVASLLDPSDTNELGIRLEMKEVAVAADRQYKTVWIAARVPLSTLTFVPDGDKLKARFSVHFAATGTESDFASGVHGEQLVEIPAATFEEVKDQNYTYVIPLNLRPAKHTIAIGVLDMLSNLSGFGTLQLNLR
ncbi:MAG TPA: VWA domain-containing protein [Thermoanaerobaculia bacterium]